MATLLVSVVAPPIPSIWRSSGEPIAARIILSRIVISVGKSDCKKNGPRDVPLRNNKHGIANCFIDNITGDY